MVGDIYDMIRTAWIELISIARYTSIAARSQSGHRERCAHSHSPPTVSESLPGTTTTSCLRHVTIVATSLQRQFCSWCFRYGTIFITNSCSDSPPKNQRFPSRGTVQTDRSVLPPCPFLAAIDDGRDLVLVCLASACFSFRRSLSFRVLLSIIQY